MEKDWKVDKIMRLKMYKLCISLLSISVLGCVYYNTFYNAKKFYAEAMKLKKDKETTPQAAKDLLDKSIEKCSKVIEYYKNKNRARARWLDDAVFLMGKCFYEKGEYQQAMRKFDELITYLPNSPFYKESHLYHGKSHLKNGDYIEAIAIFEKISDDPRASFLICEALFESQKYTKAKEKYEEFIEENPKNDFKKKAILRMAEIYTIFLDYNNAITSYKDFLKTRPPRDTRFEVELKIGKCYLELQEVELALKTFTDLKKKTVDKKKLARVNLGISECYRRFGNYEESLTILTSIIEDCPRTEESARAYYKKGMIYEENLANLDSARIAFNKVKEEHQSIGISKDALERAVSLERFVALKESLTTGETEKIAKNQFLLAELYFFDLQKFEQAIEEYEKVARDFPDTDYAPKAVYAIAWLYENEKGDSSKAAIYYKKLIDEFPNTEYAHKAKQSLSQILRENTE